jgi:hypothetical protein
MCLRLTTVEPEVAQEDIIVFKMLRFTPKKGLTAPFRYTPYNLGVVIEMDNPERFVSSEKYSAYRGHVVEEGIHSFSDLGAAYDIAKDRDRLYYRLGYKMERTDREFFVFVAVIPKGTKYFRGKFNNVESYASERLIVLDRNDPRSLQYMTNLPPNVEAVF